MNDLHIPVLLKESIELLNIKPDGIYIDCTFGRGGHSFKILEKLSKNGKLISFDRDQEAVDYFNENNKYKNAIIINSKFSKIKEKISELGIKKVDGILYDLGVSSPQIDTLERGFSYIKDYKLDMRMDQNQEKDANYILKNYSYSELFRIFKKYGDIKNPRKLCNLILEFREKNVEVDFFTSNFVNIIKESLSKKEIYNKKFPEKKYFQALRIEVNDEINEIIKSLNDSLEILNKGGRAVIITFHSLEDRIVKKIFFEKSQKLYPKEVPIKNDLQNFKIINNKFVNKDLNNSRAKSSKIRCIERC